MAAVTQRGDPVESFKRIQLRLEQSPPIICVHCGGPIVEGQNVQPVFSPKALTWSVHPVLSKPVVLRGIVSTDVSGPQ
jgi:hypothetical protein